jgi:DHA2 family multidrug resistance protein
MSSEAAIPASFERAEDLSGRKWLIAIAVALGALLEVVDTSIVNVALNEMQNSLGATLTEVSWVVSSYAVANVIILPLTAWLGERFGKKRYFIFSLIAFTAASMLCGMAQSLPMLIAARVFQGLGGGGLLAKAQAILFETFHKREQAMAQGFFGAIVIAGPAVGPTLGGYLVTNVNWRWIFFINLPVGVAAVLMCVAFLVEDDKPSTTAPAQSVDWLAILLLVLGLGSLQVVLEEGQSEDWFDSTTIIAFTILAVIGLVAFVFRELRSDRPVVDLRVLRYRSLWAGSILSVMIGISLYGTLFAVPIFAQSIMHYTSEQTGWLLFPAAIASAVTMPFAAMLVRKVDARALLLVGTTILLVALFQINRLSPQTGADDLFWPLIIRSFGTVLMFLPLSMATLGPIPKRDVGKASGFYSLTRQLGGSIGVAMLATILATRQAFHRVVLVEKLAAQAPHTLDRLRALTAGMRARGFDPVAARSQATALLDGAVNMQALVMAFGDTFWVTAALILVTVPLVFLLGKGSGSAATADH